jgi:hypothetical protein
MWGILAIIGLGVILWWVSKGLKKVSAFLENASVTLADLAIHKKMHPSQVYGRQNKIAEEKLQSITGGMSDVTYTHRVKAEIDSLLREISQRD